MSGIARRVRWTSSEAARRTRDLPPRFAAALARPGRINEAWLNARPDPLDFRDKMYEPGLVEIAPYLDPQAIPRAEASRLIRDQGPEGSCTGHALAAAIDIQNGRRRALLAQRLEPAALQRLQALIPERVSARMLYEMARTYDEYPDDGLPGSSVRGAIKGFFHNGVCSEAAAPYHAAEPGWRLTVPMSKEARCISLGAYFRLRHVLYDYHAALNEAGVIVASAMIHGGWNRPEKGVVALAEAEPRLIGAHAFAIVGYDADGFLVRNSWGPNWCSDGPFGPGIGHWRYEDWKKHVLDAWVLRLAVPSENTFHLTGGYQRSPAAQASAARAASVPRIQINGHYIHVENSRLVRSGNYWNDISSFVETGKALKELGPNGSKRDYEHLLIYAHGGLNDLDAAVARAATMTPVFKAKKIYPVFFLWRTGLWEELRDVLMGPAERVAARVEELSDLSDIALEAVARRLVRPLWEEMKADATRAMFPDGAAGLAPGGQGWEAANLVLQGAVAGGMRTHFVGHSAGAILLGELLRRASRENLGVAGDLGTISLFAPACSEAYFEALQPQIPAVLGATRPPIVIYALPKAVEREDTVGGVYRKSLLYLVSNALEEQPETPILGLEAVAARVASRHPNVQLLLSGEPGASVSQSRTHGGFDDDPATLNHLLNRILDVGRAPAEGFEADRRVTPLNGGFAEWMFEGAVPR